MMTVEEYESLKDEVDSFQSSLEQKRGELKQILKTMKEEFNCSTVEEAEKLLEELEAEQESLNKKLEKKTADLKEKWEAFENEY